MSEEFKTWGQGNEEQQAFCAALTAWLAISHATETHDSDECAECAALRSANDDMAGYW